MPEEYSHRVYVAMGSNLGGREQHITRACKEIIELASCAKFQCSSLFETDPMGPQNQPDYLNAVCRFNYTGSAHALMRELQGIEKAHGRVKATARWTARPLDLDILLFGGQQIDAPDLTVPHAGLAERSFVIWPLLELQADLHIPGLGVVSDLKKQCQEFGIRRYKRAVK